MQITLTFGDEEQIEALCALNGLHLFQTLRNIDEMLRSHLKYGQSEDAREVIVDARRRINDATSFVED